MMARAVYGTGRTSQKPVHRGLEVRSNTSNRIWTLPGYIERRIRAFKVLAWERSFLAEWMRTRGDAALSVARGNGKTRLAAALCCAVIDPAGPLHGHGDEVVAAASSFGQGRIIFEDVLDLLGPQIKAGGEGKRGEWRIQDSANRATLEHRPTGARVKCIGSDPRRMHGLRPKLVIADELSQWEPSKIDKALAALKTSLGKIHGSRLLAIGTRPEDDGHPFQKMLDGIGVALAVCYASDDPDRLTWGEIRKANPSLRALPDLRLRIADELDEARRDPALLASFVSLRMNAGTSDVAESMLIAASTWKRIESDDGQVRRPYVLGVDLGSTSAMSAACAFALYGGALDALAVFPANPDLVKRGARDGVGALYTDMHRRGELAIEGEHTANPAGLLRLAYERWGRPVAIVSDRWREGDLREALAAANFPFADLVLRGQGFKDGGEDVRAFQRMCADGDVRPRVSLLLRAAMKEARTIGDAAANHKLAKGTEGGRRKRGRDDAAAAAILAVAEGKRRIGARPRRRRIRSAVA